MYQEMNIIMQGNTLFYVIGGLIAVGIIVAIVFVVKRYNNIKKNGVEADAVVSRIEENETINDDGSTDYSYTYYVRFTAQDGQVIEARLGGAPRFTREGEQVRIKYLPEKPRYAIIIK